MMREVLDYEETIEHLNIAKAVATQTGDYSDDRFDILASDLDRAAIKANATRFLGKVAAGQPDLLLYLDKSARPYSWLIQQILSSTQPDNTPLPQYINIGKEKNTDFEWLGKRRYKGSSITWVDKLRETFQDATEPAKTVFAGKTVWIVDDFSVTGESLHFAERLIEEITARDGLPASTSAHYLSDAVSPWHGTTGLIGVTDSSDNPFLVKDCPTELSNQLSTEIGYIASELLTELSEQ